MRGPGGWLNGRAWVLLALLVGVLAVVPAAARADGLQLVRTQRLDPRLEELTFRTPALAAPTHVRVLTPAGYDPAGKQRYPVLYLLHGALDDYKSWTAKGETERATAGLPLIVVMPDGGSGGNYVDWFNDGKFGPPEWETYHIRQLIPWVDAHYRTVAARAGRAVAGLSMGGGGAMKYAAAHPDLFSAALSFSGAVDTNNTLVMAVTQITGFDDGSRTPGAIYGWHPTEELRWRNSNSWDLAENLAGLKLWILTGNGMPGGPNGNSPDPTEADVQQESLSLHQRLAAFGIPHVWDDYGPGGHQWYYWQRDLRQTLPGLMAVFAQPPAAPSPFSYTRADPDYSVYGWSVHITRPVMEFSELRDASATGFTLRGSGTGTVTTAPYFRAGAPVRATLTSGTGTTTVTVRADRGGRVRVTVPLGPGNQDQQYTPAAEVAAALRGLVTTPGSGTEMVGGSAMYATHVALAGQRARHARRHRRHR